MLTNEKKDLMMKTLSAALKKGELAGANMLVLKDGQEIFYHEDGYADIEKGEKLKRDSLFRLYSMSKPITSAAVMILVERGQIDLFDPVSAYIPGFKGQMVYEKDQAVPVKREATIRELLNMTSGLLYPREGMTGQETAALFIELENRLTKDDAMTTMELANRLGGIPLAYHPGESWAYGTSADVLGAVIEAVSGKRFGRFLKDEIFTPLDMMDTGFYVREDRLKDLATVYESVEGGQLKIYQGNHLGILNPFDRQPAFESGGAGLVGTVDDYAKFGTMLMNGGTYNGLRILEKATVQFLTGSVLDSRQGEAFAQWHTLSGHSYGNLMRVVTQPDQTGLLTVKGEYGWDGWLGCYFANIPAKKMTILLMMQKKDAGTTPLTRKLRNILLSIE